MRGVVQMMTEMVLVKKAVSKVFGDFVAKVVSDSVDVLKDAIKDADLDRKSYNQNLQTRLYQLIVDALNRFTYNKYEKQDKLYDAAGSIIKGYIRTQDNVDAVKLGLKMLVSGVNDDTCQEFLGILCGEICSDDNNDLYKEIDMLWKRRESEYIRGELVKIDQNDREMLEHINDLKEVLEFIKRNMNRQEDKTKHNGVPIVNRADEYAKKWNKNVFLNNFNKRDKNAGVNIKLKELYLEKHLPSYIWKHNRKSEYDLKKLLGEYIVDNDDKKMLLVLGQAGIGKSTLITWIMANLVRKKDQVLVYQFASDLKNVNWRSDNLLNDLFKTISLGYNEAESKILILDGFDEISTNEEKEKILDRLYQEIVETNLLKKFTLIIMCRENYIYESYKLECDYITLQIWDEKQIKSFCDIYGKISGTNISSDTAKMLLESKSVFGIPLVLYMVLALNVAIGENGSIVDIYDQIFSLNKNSMYDRCIRNSRFGSKHRIGQNNVKQQIHQISREIAFWIFENNPDEAFISQIKCDEICETVINELSEGSDEIKRDYLIGNYFKLIKYCEGIGTNEIQFVHRSIYEYFVAVCFYESIRELETKEEIAGKLGILLKDGQLSKQLCRFIKYKFDSLKRYDLPEKMKDVFQLMLRNGMAYYVGKPVTNIIEREMNIFANMLEIVNLWDYDLNKIDDNIITYLHYNERSELNLKGMGLENKHIGQVYLEGADLEGANLKGVHLEGANLKGAHLEGADLEGANLKGAHLEGARLWRPDIYGDIIEVNLRGAILRAAIFDERQADWLCGKYVLHSCQIRLSKTGEIVYYKEHYS